MALPKYKEIVDLIKKGATIEAQEQIMALREAALDLQEENVELRERVKELEKSVRQRGKTVFYDGVYWVEESDGRDGPYCQHCFDVEGLLVRLHKAQFQRPSDRQWFRGGLCRRCGGKHEIEM